MPRSCMIDEYSAHRLRSDRKKVRPVLPVHLTLVDQFQVRLVDQSCRLERVADALASEIVCRLSMQLSVNDRHQRVECIFLSEAPLMQPKGDLGLLVERLRHRFEILRGSKPIISLKALN